MDRPYEFQVNIFSVQIIEWIKALPQNRHSGIMRFALWPVFFSIRRRSSIGRATAL
jgi:hypothetical protein